MRVYDISGRGMTFRFDDVCINADMGYTNLMTDYLLEKFPLSQVLWGVSPLVHDMSSETGKARERVFPSILNAYSDHRLHFNVDMCGLPELRKDVTIATHGLIHVDHRLLTCDQQEMSILISASLVKSKIFIPPFNKWNEDTADVCFLNKIELVKFEDGWLSMEHNKFNPFHRKWYLHAREFSVDEFKQWFDDAA
jgi:hypothetical protein